MPGRITSLEAIGAVKDVFRSGIPSIKLLGLSEEDAVSWRDTFELEGDRYGVTIDGPSKLNDPAGSNPFYSVTIIYNRGRG